MSTLVATVLVVVLVALIALVVWRSVRIIPQARAGIVERFGRYHRTLNAGLNMVVPFVDRLLPLPDLREQVFSFPPQPAREGEAEASRPGQAGRDLVRGGHQAVRYPERRRQAPGGRARGPRRGRGGRAAPRGGGQGPGGPGRRPG